MICFEKATTDIIHLRSCSSKATIEFIDVHRGSTKTTKQIIYVRWCSAKATTWFKDVYRGSTKATIQIIRVRWSQRFHNSNYRVDRSALGFHLSHSADFIDMHRCSAKGTTQITHVDCNYRVYSCALVCCKSNYRVCSSALGWAGLI